MIRWAWWFAWRDARADRRWLVVYVSTIVAGVAALEAVRSFAYNLELAVDAEAKALLGADLEIYARQPFDPAAEELIAEIGGEQARQVRTASMATFPQQGETRLSTVRAVEPGFPFYGELETLPADAAARFPRPRTALVDSTLMLQFGVQVGDTVKIGEVEFRIAGRLLRIPGEVPTASLVGPRVFIPLQDLEATRLIRPGSRARYSVFFRLPQPPEQVSELVGDLRERLRASALEAETVQYRRRLVGRGLENMNRFLYLTGFAALLLGGVGVASSMHLYARSKTAAVATLRCVGASPGAPVVAFAMQAVALGSVGATLGAVAGVIAQRLLPWGLASFLPIEVEFGVSPGAILEGLATGTVVALLFALLPLVGLRRVSPSAALRMFVAPASGWRDPAAWGIVGLCLVGLTAVGTYGSGDLRLVSGLLGGLALALAALAGVAALTRAVVRRLLPPAWPFVIRQGLAKPLPTPQPDTRRAAVARLRRLRPGYSLPDAGGDTRSRVDLRIAERCQPGGVRCAARPTSGR